MDPATRETLADLLLAWEDAFRAGHDLPAADLARDHPDLIEPLERRIRVLKATFWIDHPRDPVDGESDPPPPGGRLLAGRYRLDERIALGGFAEVWRAFDTELHRTVAVKIPKASRIAMNDAFMAEARRVARLRHPSIAPVHDVGTDGDSCFIVSEFMDGGSLADRIASGPLAPAQALRWIAQIADALDFAHRSGVVHRDVKPANILLNHHGDAMLADFGIAQSATKSGAFAPSIGTLRYMAPEQLTGGPVGPTADIYSLGIVLHEAITGKTPHAGAEPFAIRSEVMADRDLAVASSLPRRIATICRRAIRRDPRERHATAAQFAADLRQATSATAPPHRNRRLLATASAAVVVAAALFALPGPRPRPLPPRAEPGPPTPVTPAVRPAAALTAASRSSSASIQFLRIADSLPYVVETDNIVHFSEWQSPPATYLGPQRDDLEGFVIYRFDFTAPVTRARLIAMSRCWDFTMDPGGQGRGAAVIDASADGAAWTPIRGTLDGPAWGDDWTIDESLPATVVGGTSLWIRARLLTNGSPNTTYSVAQFGRNRDDPSQPTFGIVAELEDTPGRSR
jgi:serine/threonine protein kinase